MKTCNFCVPLGNCSLISDCLSEVSGNSGFCDYVLQGVAILASTKGSFLPLREIPTCSLRCLKIFTFVHFLFFVGRREQIAVAYLLLTSKAPPSSLIFPLSFKLFQKLACGPRYSRGTTAFWHQFPPQLCVRRISFRTSGMASMARN